MALAPGRHRPTHRQPAVIAARRRGARHHVPRKRTVRRHRSSHLTSLCQRVSGADGVILGYGLLFEPARDAPRPCVQHALGLPIVRSPTVQAGDPFFRATSAVCNIPTLTAAAHGLRVHERGAGSRRHPSAGTAADAVPGWCLSLAVTRRGSLAHRARNLVLRIANVNTASLALDGQDVPLDGKAICCCATGG